MSYALNRLGSARFLSPITNHHSPLFISVEPAAVCQLKCPACPVGQRQSSIIDQSSINRKSSIVKSSIPTMSPEVWSRVLEQIREKAMVVQFYFQGEPLLNKNLPSMIRDAHEAGLYTIVSTNAQAMTQELAQDLVDAGLDRIIISMDGLSQETYEAYRIGGSLEKTKAAIRFLKEAKNKSSINRKSSIVKSSILIELQCLRLRSNEHEWSEFRRVYKSLGADRLTLKTAQLYDYTHGHPLMPSDPKYSRYIQSLDGTYHRRPLSKGCFRVWSGCVITTSGEVLPCCYDKNHDFSYGNIMNTSLQELFQNDAAHAFRNAAFQQTPKICQECYK